MNGSFRINEKVAIWVLWSALQRDVSHLGSIYWASTSHLPGEMNGKSSSPVDIKVGIACLVDTSGAYTWLSAHPILEHPWTFRSNAYDHLISSVNSQWKGWELKNVHWYKTCSRDARNECYACCYLLQTSSMLMVFGTPAWFWNLSSDFRSRGGGGTV